MRLEIQPLWCCYDTNTEGKRTWASEVTAILLPDDCDETVRLKIGNFTWPPLESGLRVRSANDAIEGAAHLAIAEVNIDYPNVNSYIIS